MTEFDLISFLKENLKLTIDEERGPFEASNCRKLKIKLLLKTSDEQFVLSEESLKIYEGQR